MSQANSSGSIRSFPLRRIFTLACALAFGWTAFGHEGPEHEIEELTTRIAREGESADLLTERGIEYAVLGKLAEAARDFEKALQSDPRSALARRELSRAYFASGKTNEALQTVTRGIDTTPPGPDHAALLTVRAEFLRARSEHRQALADANRAIGEQPGSVECYLLRSQLQARLKLHTERLRGLEEGIRETGAGVLQAEWVQALLDAGQTEKALARIEAELADSRWKSTWLLRRAQARLALGKKSEADADLKAAIEELDQRIRPSAPEPSLSADRGLAFELLGKAAEARKDYQTARDKGFAEEWMLDRLDALKKQAPAESREEE